MNLETNAFTLYPISAAMLLRIHRPVMTSTDSSLFAGVKGGCYPYVAPLFNSGPSGILESNIISERFE